MSESETDDEESATGWTSANLLKLVGCIRSNIPQSEKTRDCRTGLSAVDWEKVAFSPFSPEECQEKWKSMMEKMRKLRSLPELIAEAEEVVSNPLLHRKIHPELPKSPSPPKMVYMWKHFSKFKKKHPGLPMTKIVKMAFKKYDELPDEEKAKYEKKHALALEEYRRKMEDFRKENDLPMSRTSERKKRVPDKDDEGLPEKPPPNAFSLFIKGHAKADKTLGACFIKDMGQRWRDLSETERQEYYTRYQEMKRNYYAKLMEYLDRFDETEKQQIIKEKGLSLPKKDRPLRRMLPSEPKMPSQAGFVYFAKDQMTFLKKKISNHADRLAKAKKLWYKLPTKEKERYKEQIRSNMKRYSEDLQKWFETLTSEEQTEYLKQKPNKLQFLEARKQIAHGREELLLCQPSDSEDEDIVVFNSEEERDNWSSYEDENGVDEEDGDLFQMYY
ncbi:nucleolar transcription factor 1-like isoform 2-T2 [Anableps anableps]